MSDDAKEWQEGLKRYLKWVEGQHSTMRLLGQPRPVPLEGIFTDVYVLDRPSASRRVGIEELRRRYAGGERHHKAQRRSGMEMVEREPRLFILGKPGAGKTTFLKYVALQEARRKPTQKVPIFVSLKELADSGRDLLSFIIEQVEAGEFTSAENFVKRVLKAGRALVLLDGLDEAQQADFNLANLLLDINRLTSRYPESQYLVTCRLAATEYQFERFTYVEMADFTQPQIKSYVGKWFGEEPARGKRFLEELAKPDHRGLQELAQVPLLLTLLCLAFDETLSFPQRRVEVYNEAVEALLRKWDGSRGIRRPEMLYKELAFDRKRQMLSRLAFDTFESGHYFIPQAELEAKIMEWLRQLPSLQSNEAIDGRAILKAIEAQHGLFVERAQEIYSFAHLSFQEYFTAKYLVETEGLFPFLMTKITEPRWREVFLLVASLLPNADRFFDSFLAALDRLVADQPPIVDRLEWAERKADTTPTSYKAEAVRALALNLVVNLDLALALSFDLDLAFNRTVHRTHTRALALVLDPALNLDRARARNHFRFRYRDLDLDRALHRSRLLQDIIQDARRTSRLLGLYELHVALHGGPVAGKHSASPGIWQVLADYLTAHILAKLQPNPNWNLSSEQTELLTTYLTANLLLLDCLAVAIVSDRDGIKARLLRPPAPKTKPPAPGGTEG